MDEELLESKVAFLSKREPLLLRESVEVNSELFEQSPGLVLLLEFITHLVVVGQSWFAPSEVFTVSKHFLYSILQCSPLLSHFTHGLCCFQSLLVGQLIAFFRLFLLPFVEHLFQVTVESFNFGVELLNESRFLLLNFVLEGC